jgi:gliding motility-associated-like protein
LHILLALISSKGYAQDIPVINPSLDGVPKENAAPAGWHGIKTTDLQPGIYKITLQASDGNTYVGLHSGPDYVEGISQQVSGKLKAEHPYSMYFDLAFAPVYALETCYGNLAIYGGNAPGDTAELLWTSGEFIHTSWKRYNAFFSPGADYQYISLCAYYSRPCDKSKYGVAVLIDNLSAYIYDQLKLEFSASTTCKNSNTGAVIVKASGGTAPFTYQWSPGGSNSSSLSNLPAGIYKVSVTDSKGATVQGEVTIHTSDLAAQVTVTSSKCYGDQQGSIAINTTGGMPPYHYYLNDSHNSIDTPVFEHLPSGNYKMLVKDEQGCSNELDNIQEIPPPPLLIQQANIRPCSCGEARNGRIVLQMQGGTPPYEYQINNGIWQTDSVFGQLPPGYYQYEIRDRHACSVSGAGEITSPWKNCLVVMPTAFSPNGDGNNDIFRPRVYDDVHNYRLRVYNRWGGLIFQSNDPEKGWDGTYKGAPQEAQGFIYICTFNDRNNAPREMQGAVTLVR